MARILVLGAGTGGLLAAIALARRGHAVSLVEKDPRPARITAADALTAWHRRGTPQALMPHGLMPRARLLLREHAPDVLAKIYEAGAIDFDLGAFAPGGAPIPSDDDLRVLFCRRPLIESVLWDAVEHERSVDLRAGVGASALLLSHDGGTPRVDGIVTDTGEELRADLVVDASGRRTPVWKWLREAGVSALPGDRVEPCGVVYYARYYALREGASLPRGRWLWGPRAELPYALAIVHLADRGVFSITLALPTDERDLRVIRDDAAFDAMCSALPDFAPWVSPERSVPISPVLTMGGLQNVLRAFVHDGEPLARGLFPLGDALCHTNPAYGWGVALGAVHVYALADALERHPADLRAAALDYHAAIASENDVRWHVSVEQDRARARAWHGEAAAGDDVKRATTLRTLQAAAMLDARVYRAVFRFMTLLDPATAIFDDGALLDVARSALAAQPPPAPPAVPSRAEIFAVLDRFQD